MRRTICVIFSSRAYDPADYSHHLDVPADIKDLFQYIGRYEAHAVDIDTTLCCCTHCAT